MSWRTVVIANLCKLDLKMGYMVIRGEDTKRVFLDEIAILIIESPTVSLTGCLLAALTEKKIKVIFCDEKRNPAAELIPYNGSYDCSRKIKMQMAWNDNIKCAVWAEIISEKIRKQADFLQELEKKHEAALLRSYISQIAPYDTTNREGHAAKVYFNGVFGMEFTRSDDNCINAALNYGYGIILAAFNREVVANGYLTQLGIFHDNRFNFFNLSCDLMEPFRILVDRQVYFSSTTKFDSTQKHRLLSLLNQYVTIDSIKQTVLNAIKIYVRSVFEALNDDDICKIKFFKV